MPGIVTHYTVSKTRRIFFNHATDNVDLTARFNRLHRTVEGFFSTFDQQTGFFIDIAHQQGFIGVAVHSIKVCGDVKVQNVAVLKYRGVWNAVANNLIQ